MGTTTQKTLRMSFLNQSGGQVSITIPNPSADVTKAEIETVMDAIIAKNIFTSSGGDFVTKQDIKIIDQTVNDLLDPA